MEMLIFPAAARCARRVDIGGDPGGGARPPRDVERTLRNILPTLLYYLITGNTLYIYRKSDGAFATKLGRFWGGLVPQGNPWDFLRFPSFLPQTPT